MFDLPILPHETYILSLLPDRRSEGLTTTLLLLLPSFKKR
jgi:hypothetical protein